MELFTWSDKYSVNIKDIDNQHKNLISIINELYSAMSLGKGRDVLGKTLQALIVYTRTHFAAEERLMNIHGYQEYSMHKPEHEKFIEHIFDFQKRFQEGNTIISIELMYFLKDWLSNHILVSDKKYSPFLNKKGII